MALDPNECPKWARDSLDRYWQQGIPTGGFLRAVLANDLMQAYLRADPRSVEAMASIVAYVYHRIPAAAQGSHEAVDAWIAMHLEKRRAAEAVRVGEC